MTISATGRVYKQACDGSTVAFPFGRNFYQFSDIKVFLVDNVTGASTPLSYSTDYTMAGLADTSGGTGYVSGTITTNVAYPSGKTLVYYGDVDEVQNLDLSSVTQWSNAAIEDALDKITIMVQEVNDRIALMPQALRTRLGSFDYTLPVPQPGFYLGVKSDGSGWQYQAPASQAFSYASQAEAETGSENSKIMTALRVNQASNVFIKAARQSRGIYYCDEGSGGTFGAALNNLISTIPNGSTVIFPYQNSPWVADQQIVLIGKSKIKLRGEKYPILQRGNSLSALAIDKACDQIDISGLLIDGNSAGFPAAVAAFVSFAPRTILDDMAVYGASSHGVLISNQYWLATTGPQPVNNRIRRLEAYNNAGIGVTITSADYTQLEELYCHNNTLEGCTVDSGTNVQGSNAGSKYVTVKASRFEANAGGVGGFGGENCDDLMVIGCRAIANTNGGFVIQNNIGATLRPAFLGCVARNNSGPGFRLKTGPLASPGAYPTSNATFDGCHSFANTQSVLVDAGSSAFFAASNDFDIPVTDNSGITYGRDIAGVGPIAYFQAQNATTRTNVTGDNTNYTVPFDSIVANKGGGYAAGVFTVPSTVKSGTIMEFDAAVFFTGTGSQTFGNLSLVSSNAANTRNVSRFFPALASSQSLALKVSLPVAPGETYQIKLEVDGATKNVSVSNDTSRSWFSGRVLG